jgi:hypothetical protein
MSRDGEHLVEAMGDEEIEIPSPASRRMVAKSTSASDSVSTAVGSSRTRIFVFSLSISGRSPQTACIPREGPPLGASHPTSKAPDVQCFSRVLRNGGNVQALEPGTEKTAHHVGERDFTVEFDVFRDGKPRRSMNS